MCVSDWITHSFYARLRRGSFAFNHKMVGDSVTDVSALEQNFEAIKKINKKGRCETVEKAKGTNLYYKINPF